ncbi:acyl-CoA dehydrogenase family protein [Streptomyces sp. Ag109_G2-15]|uniref:acyl-CoA dehydrogenase family protein n=1 Tax=Streptomyces sp. Ag109_G2-15 TaxID=1938850 RepID=UPI000BD87DAA|nr:acyl-CoA dehydrogenase family protein [Streptomyces sp. Ag109_G2-15]SOD80753.1 Acyl-CoA dehydrogenase [Streptomyces sp. Ag109_G2-15]
MTTAALSFVDALYSGRLSQDLFRYPVQSASDRAEGDAAVAELTAFLRDRLDPDQVDLTGTLPEGFLDDLRASGYLKLRLGMEIGGLDLSAYNAFRAIEHAAGHCMPAGQMLAIQAGVGAPALLPALPPGSLREFVTKQLAGGAVSGFGLTEPAGQNNAWPGTTATRSADGSVYVLRGEKVFTGHGPVANLLPVAATEHTEEGRRLCICFVDTSAAGFEVTSRIEFTGSRGLPNGALRFDGLEVPAEYVVRSDPEDARFPDRMASAVLIGQLYFTAAPAVAIAKLCRRWSGEFVTRRRINGRALSEYDEIQRMLGETLAEVYAMESVTQWSLLGSGPEDRWFERLTAKNLAVRTCWRIVDRTVSLYGAEGIETLPSKLRRGAVPVPLERRLRDARGLRIAGNVDFQLDSQAARRLLTWFATRAEDESGALARGLGAEHTDEDRLSGANAAHLAAVREQVLRFHEVCRELTRSHPRQEDLFEQEHTVILLGRVAAELFAMYAVLARAGTEQSGDDGEQDGQRLADVYCASARHRLADHWRRLGMVTEPDYAGISTRWLTEGLPRLRNEA